MTKSSRILSASVLFFLLGSPLFAGQVVCPATGETEKLHYTWHLRGVLSWVARVKFPTSGNGDLRTSALTNSVNSNLVITGKGSNSGDFYEYKSQMDPSGDKTLTSYHGYSFDAKERKEQTLFDYVKKLVRIRKQSAARPEELRVKKLGADSARDILTGIYFLRQNATTITQPISSQVYSDGTVYPVVFRPLGRGTVKFNDQQVAVRKFLITAAPGSEEKWPGGVEVALTDDDRRIPLRIELQQSYASLELNLQTIESCGFELAAK